MKSNLLSWLSRSILITIIIIIAFVYIKNNLTPYSPGRGWSCIQNIDTPVRMIRGDVACASHNYKDCMWGACSKRTPLPEHIRPLKCGAQYKRIFKKTGYEKASHWCNKGALAMTGIIPNPPKKCMNCPKCPPQKKPKIATAKPLKSLKLGPTQKKYGVLTPKSKLDDKLYIQTAAHRILLTVDSEYHMYLANHPGRPYTWGAKRNTGKGWILWWKDTKRLGSLTIQKVWKHTDLVPDITVYIVETNKGSFYSHIPSRERKCPTCIIKVPTRDIFSKKVRLDNLLSISTSEKQLKMDALNKEYMLYRTSHGKRPHGWGSERETKKGWVLWWNDSKNIGNTTIRKVWRHQNIIRDKMVYIVNTDQGTFYSHVPLNERE